MAIDDQDGPSGPCRPARREFVKIGGAAISATLTTRLLPAFAATPDIAGKSIAYPVVSVAALASVKINAPIAFTYPDENSPAVLLRLHGPAEGGIGTDYSIVAYSALCTHKGCPVSYRPERKLLICPCHWSSFDPSRAGEMVIGQGSQALPQIRLRVRDGTIEAFGVGGLIYGRHVNIL